MSQNDDLIDINLVQDDDGNGNDDTGADTTAANPDIDVQPNVTSPAATAHVQFINVDPATSPAGNDPGTANIADAPAATSPAGSTTSASPHTSPTKTINPGLKPSIINRRATKSSTIPVGLNISAAEANQKVIQSYAIDKLIKLIKIEGSQIFRDPRIEKIKYFPDSHKRGPLLVKFFNSVLPGGFINFDKQTNDILQNYLDTCATVFDVVLQRHEKQFFSTQIRLLIIAVAFGIDRALTSLKFKDKLFHHFHTSPQDDYHQHIYDKPELLQRAPNLVIARDYYFDYFRIDGFNPFNNGENVPIFGPITTYTPVVHHSFSTPVPEQEFQTSFFEDIQDNPEHLIKYQEPASSDTDQDVNMYRPSTHKQNKREPSPSDSDDNYRRQPSGRSSRQYYQERPPSRTQSRSSYRPCDIDPRASSRYSTRRTPSPEYDSDSEEDYDPKTPRTPLQQDLTRNYHSRLSTAGHVYDKDHAMVKRKSRKSSFISAIAREIQQMGLPEEQRNSIMGTSLGIAHSINAFTKEGQKQQRDTYRVISPPPSDLDLRPHSFDYDSKGYTPEEILGKRFSKLRFPSEAVRQSTMKSIFQTVADDPDAPVYTKKIANSQLGQIDNPNITKQEIQHFLSKTISRLDNHHDPDIIPPPELGENNLDGRVLKTLQTRLGIDDRLSFDDMTSGLFKSTLRNLASIITNAGLREEEAYALMRRITKGTSQTTVEINEFEHQLPFKDYWITIQKTHRQSNNTEEFKTKLSKLLASERVDNFHKALNQIMIYTFKIFEKEVDPCYRRLLIQRECLKNFRTFLRRLYAPYFSQINTCFADKLRQMALEENDPSYTNENIYHQRKTQIFLEVACEVLSQHEPDEQPRVRQPRQGVYAIAQQENHHQKNQEDQRDHQPRRQQQQEHQRNFRTSNQNQENRPTSRANNQFQGRPPSRSATPNRRPSYNCHLCNRQGHSFRQCNTYPNEERGPSFCEFCGGSHKSECKTKGRKKISNIAIDQQPNRSSTPYNNQQNFQRTPSRNFQYQGNNQNGRPRSQNGYRFNGQYNRPFTPNGQYNRPFTPNGQQRSNYQRPYYNNNQQRNFGNQQFDRQNRYQQPYFRGNNMNPNFMPIGPRRNSRYNDGSQTRQFNQTYQKYDRQQDPPQQEKRQDPPTKTHGLGNAGYQAIPINARLAKIAKGSDNRSSTSDSNSDNDQ